MVGKSQKTTQQNSATSKTPAPTSQANASSVAASSGAASKDDKLEAMAGEESSTVLSTIHLMQKDFSKKFEDVLAGINGIKSELQSQANRITEAEDRIGRAEDNVDAMNSTIKKLQEKCATLETRVEDQENRGRRNNLRLVGLPERAEGQDVCIFGRMAWHRHLHHSTCHRESASDRTTYRWPGSKTKSGNYEVPQLQRKRKSCVSSPKTERHAVSKPQRQILSRLHRQQRLFGAVKRGFTMACFTRPSWQSHTMGSDIHSRRSPTQKSLAKAYRKTTGPHWRRTISRLNTGCCLCRQLPLWTQR